MEILVALFGVVGAVLAAAVGTHLSREKKKNAETALNNEANDNDRFKTRGENLVDFFELCTTGAVEVDIAVDEYGKSVFFYQAPLKVHLTHIECFLQ